MCKTRKLKRDENDYLGRRVFTFARKFDHLVNKQQTDNIGLSAEAMSTSSFSVTSIDNKSNQDRGEGTSEQGRNSFLEEIRRIRIGNLKANTRSGRVERPDKGIEQMDQSRQEWVRGLGPGRSKNLHRAN